MAEVGRRVRTLLSSASLADGELVDVLIDDGVVEQVAPVGSLRHEGAAEIHLNGYLLLPALAEPHTHLDKAFTRASVPNPTQDLMGAVSAWLEFRSSLSVEDIRERARAAALLYLAHGCTLIRSHVDAGVGIELRAVEALLEVRQELAGVVDIELVALPTRPLVGRAGASNRSILRAALEMGADLIGGAPHTDTDPKAYLTICMGLASDLSRPVDLHMDETLDRSTLWLRELVAIVLDGFPHPVTASHCVSLGIQPPSIQAEIAHALATAGIAVVTCPITNLYLQGRKDTVSPPRGLTALGPLASAGVIVAAGGDNTQDPFNPLGKCDPLQTAQFLVAAGHISPQVAYRMVSAQARRVMGKLPVSVAAGARADLLAVAAESVEQALATVTEERWVWSLGRQAARTKIDRSFAIRDH